MTPERKFNSAVLSAMVFIVFLGVGFLAPRIQSIPFWQQAVAAVAAMLASAGTYGLIASFLSALIRKNRIVKKFTLGPYYMEGTWVGYFVGHAGDLRYVVEILEQELESLIIRGYSFAEDGRQHGQWTSEAAYVDIRLGKLTYMYTCDILTRGVPYQGIGVFDLQRPSASEPPTAIHGYVADLVDGQRLPVKESRIADYTMSLDQGVNEAKQLWATCLSGLPPRRPSVGKQQK